MAVYAQLAAEDIARFLHAYDVGTLASAKGIAEGVSNSNWLVDTSAGRFILTRYEARTDPADLPYFLALLDHLAAAGAPVPRTIHTRDGDSLRSLAGRPAALIEFLPGLSLDEPGPDQLASVGAALAQIHRAAEDFPMDRANGLGRDAVGAMLDALDVTALARIDPALPGAIEGERAWLSAQPPHELPGGTIHADLFPDNVLFRDGAVSGLIDFYFACTDRLALDIATTHAAWCFDPSGATFHEARSAALLAGYRSHRTISDPERTALPALAREACLRFVATRSQDWLAHDGSVFAPRKDPMDFIRRARHYASLGTGAFAAA